MQASRRVYNDGMVATPQSLTLESLATEADRCVACGLCLPHCPTYRKTGSEADSPRGRIQLMRAVSQGVLPNNARFQEHIDLCLSCRSCESACPNTVNYGALVDATRALHIPKSSLWYRFSKPLLRSPALQQIFGKLLWLLQFTGVQHVLARVWPVLQGLQKVDPPHAWNSVYPASAAKQGAVSLFLGCASNALDQQTLRASVYVLNQLGYDVHVPPQNCCGSIARQMGDAAERQQLVAQNRSHFDPALPVISCASGCGAALKEDLAEHQVHDIHSFLAQCDWQHIELAPLPAQIHVQDPCTLRNVLKGQQAVYNLLKKIPQADIQPLPGNAQCCGGAGTYMLTQTDMAERLLADKLSAIDKMQTNILVTANIGCGLHIARGLSKQNKSAQVLHPVHLLARQMGYPHSLGTQKNRYS